MEFGRENPHCAPGGHCARRACSTALSAWCVPTGRAGDPCRTLVSWQTAHAERASRCGGRGSGFQAREVRPGPRRAPGRPGRCWRVSSGRVLETWIAGAAERTTQEVEGRCGRRNRWNLMLLKLEKLHRGVKRPLCLRETSNAKEVRVGESNVQRWQLARQRTESNRSRRDLDGANVSRPPARNEKWKK